MIFTSQKKFDDEVSKEASDLCDQLMMEIGSELHDDLIQKLSVFRLYMDRMERSSHDRVEIESLLINMRTDFEAVIDSIRRISRSFLPEPVEHESFNSTLESLCKSLEKPGLGKIYFQTEGSEQPIPENVRRNLYRIVQELIHNSFKHSSAWHIYVQSLWTEHCLVINVEDDGSGFNKVSEFIDALRKKTNTLRLRTQAIGAVVTYHHGSKGLLVSVEYTI